MGYLFLVVAPMGAGKTWIHRQVSEHPKAPGQILVPHGGGWVASCNVDVDEVRTPTLESRLKPLRRGGDWREHDRIWYGAVADVLQPMLKTWNIVLWAHHASISAALARLGTEPTARFYYMPSWPTVYARIKQRTESLSRAQRSEQLYMALKNWRAVAYDRELFEYRHLLPNSPLFAPSIGPAFALNVAYDPSEFEIGVRDNSLAPSGGTRRSSTADAAAQGANDGE